MLDPQIILEEPQRLEAMLKKRNWDALDCKALQNLIAENKALTSSIQQAQAQRNQLSKEIGRFFTAKEARQEDSQLKDSRAKVQAINQNIQRLEKKKLFSSKSSTQSYLLCQTG